DFGVEGRDVVWRGVATEQPLEFGEDIDEEVFAAEVGDDVLLDLAAFADGFDDADILMDGAAGGADFDGPRVHENHYHDIFRDSQGESWELTRILGILLSRHFSARERVV